MVGDTTTSAAPFKRIENKCPPNLILPPAKQVTWDAALAREQARLKRQREGGQHTDLSDRLDEHPLHEHPKRVLTDMKATPFFPEYEMMVEDLVTGAQDITPVESKHCPFHQVILDLRVSKNIWLYYRCPVRGCPMFCGADAIDDWTKGLTSQLHDSYKEQPDPELTITLPFICYCLHESFHGLKLNKSKSATNPNRFYLGCQHRTAQGLAGCNFFQWLDTPLLARNVSAWFPQQNN